MEILVPPYLYDRASRRARGLLGWLALPLWALTSGCFVEVYEPLSGLHRPVVVDPQLPNFADTKLAVHCVPGGLLNPVDASLLCKRVKTLFERQGAQVDTFVGRPEVESAPVGTPPATELAVELRARLVDKPQHGLSWLLCIGSFGLVPAISEYSFAQDVVIRDRTGFLLVTDTLQGRIVSRYGFGPWFGNTVANWWRSDADKIKPETPGLQLSTDLYRQLSQLVFNAKMHARVLEQAPPVTRAD